MTKVLLLHNTLDHDMTITNGNHYPIALLTDLLTDPLTDMTLVTDIDHARIQEITTILPDIHLHRPPSRPKDSRFSRSRSNSNTRNKLITIQPQHQSDPINFEVRMYHPTEMANAVTPTIWFYSLYTHTTPNQIQRDYPSRLEI